MDKKKINKDGKVGADGLTKKERRALKVQARQTDDNKAELKNIQAKPSKEQVFDSNKQTNGDVSIKVDKATKSHDKDISAASIGDVNSTQKSECELSEKEKRKLEWEKRLAEQKKDSNKNKSSDENQTVSKAEQKARRRETQEAQRLAKAKTETEVKKKSVENTSEEKKVRVAAVRSKTPVKKNLKHPIKHVHKKVQLFDDLYVEHSKSSASDDVVNHPNIHPAFIQLGDAYSTRSIIGSNARCISLFSALNRLILDTETPPEQEFCRYLESVLQNCTDYLSKCRPMALSILNPLRLFKLQLTHLDTSLSDKDKKTKLLNFSETYIKNEIITAGEAISLKLLAKLSDGDIILTYGYSSLINKILTDAFRCKKQFKVIIVNSRPLFEGKKLWEKLKEAGIDSFCIGIHELSHNMPRVTKVLLGAHCVLNNGHVMSRAGTAQVALMAQVYSKPVLVCCETYKFCEKIQTDSLVNNEIGDPDQLLTANSALSNWRKKRNITPLNLLYDLTPADFVSTIITEIAIIPCTSVPAVLRLKATESSNV